jgi:hypothetical protein
MNTTVIVNVGTLNAEAVALIDRIMNRPAASAALTPPPQAIPIAQPGEHYAGLAFVDGKPSHHLFLLDAKPTGDLTWAAAQAWAKSIDASLPTRFESALLYANLRDQFDQNRWHWTDTQSSAADAWYQDFYYGGQYAGGKSGEFLARAVRRLEIDPSVL